MAGVGSEFPAGACPLVLANEQARLPEGRAANGAAGARANVLCNYGDELSNELHSTALAAAGAAAELRSCLGIEERGRGKNWTDLLPGCDSDSQGVLVPGGSADERLQPRG